MDKKVFLITGGAGFIGSHIAEEILRQGLGRVIVYDNLSSGFERNIRALGDDIEFVRGDVRDGSMLRKHLGGVDYVFHDAAFVSAFDSYNHPDLTNEINVGGTLNVLDAAVSMGVKKIVLASSAAIYGPKSQLPNEERMAPDPASPYATSKAEIETLAKAFSKKRGIETVCLRYFNVYGPRQDPMSEYSGVISIFADRIKQGLSPVIYGDGSQTRDFVFVRDVARANILATLSEKCKKGEVINIGTGREINLLEMGKAFGKAYEKDVKPEFRPWREGDIKRSVASIKLARSLLGFEPETGFETGIKELVEYLEKFDDVSLKFSDKFIANSKDRIKDLDACLNRLRIETGLTDLYEPLYHIFHRFHGSAQIYGYDRVGLVAELCEKFIYDKIQTKSVLSGEELAFLGVVKRLIEDEIQGKRKISPGDVNEVMKKL